MRTDAWCIMSAPSSIGVMAMPKAFDRTGLVYGKLTVLSLAGKNKHSQRIWLCQCECGNTTIVSGGSLTTGNTKSCGCEEGFFKHGGYKNSSYNTWRAMMRRCYNPKDKDYAKYGAQGVTVQDSWHDYLSFAADMGEPEGTRTLHRVDPYGAYEKGNCVWATPTEQVRTIRIPKKNKTGHIGVGTINGKYFARITAEKKVYKGKIRSTLEEALADRQQMERTYWSGNG